MKRIISFTLCIVIILSALGGCAARRDESGETRKFVDSAGREVEIPVEIDAVAPSGSLAQMILYTLCPDKLIGLSDAFSQIQKEYIDEKYWDLPVLGKLYGSSGTLNLEEIVKESPDIIIDIGERKSGIGADMDTVQEQTGVPVVFIEATLGTMEQAYDTLGELLGVSEKASEMSKYIGDVLKLAEDVKNKVPEADRPRVLYSQGEYGTEVNGKDSIHSEVLEFVGVTNAADMDSVLSTGGDEVSMEQIILWNPDVVVLAPGSNYGEIFDDPSWAQVDAVKNGLVYEVPMGPYNWFGRPPSVQRILGIMWLGNLVYPEYYDFDIIEKAREFYELFFHCGLTDAQARELLKNSTLS